MPAIHLMMKMEAELIKKPKGTTATAVAARTPRTSFAVSGFKKR
jgi:hypothetical protein